MTHVNEMNEILKENVVPLAQLDECGKWSGIIAYSDDHPSLPHHAILTSVPIYDTAEEARAAMAAVISDIREFAQACGATEFGESIILPGS